MKTRKQSALVSVSVADLRMRPSHTSELLTQAVLGGALEVGVRSADDKWFKVSLPDGYCGWMRSWSVTPVPAVVSRAWQAGLKVQVTARSAAVMERPRTSKPGTSGELVCELPLGTRLPVLRVRGGWAKTTLPDERTGWVRRCLLGEIPARPCSPSLILDRAREFMGAPYVWGGVTPWGCDCSGLVQTVFASCGVALPRDVREQLEVLQPVLLDCRARSFRRGDLLFFGTRRKVSHVAISTGGRGFIHAYGYVREGNLERGHRGFLPGLVRLFRAAARPLEGGKKDVDKKRGFP